MASNKLVRTEAFDQPVILQQSSFWSRAIVWGIVGVTSFVIIWANVAKIEEAVPATGKLEPTDQVREVQAPVGGVVKEVLVKDGQSVKQGDVLIRFDTTAAGAQKASLQRIILSLQQENAFYRSVLAGVPVGVTAQLRLPPEMLSLAANRAAFVSENRLYQAQLTGNADGASLTPEQRVRMQFETASAGSADAAAQLEVSQLREQLGQAQVQLAAARDTLKVDQTILDRLTPLAEQGGIAQVQFWRQQQEVTKGRAEVLRLSQEVQRFEYAIEQAKAKYANTFSVSRRDWLTKMGDNEKQIAAIDSQFNKAIVDNEKKIAETFSQLSQAEVTLKYQELRAPIDGTVFDLKAKGPGFVPNTNTNEPVLKIVPKDALTAEVYVTNKDIGFVREGMHVDIRVDSFPFSEFGDIKGTLTQVGSDALPPDQIHQYYRFPAKVTLDRQYIDVKGQQIPLQSGMSVTGNIITRNRTVMSIFTDLFSQRIESLKTVR
jgi:HlyD family secretion protein